MQTNPQLKEGVLTDLLACDGDLFIRRAYWVLLGREPDASGLQNYQQELRRGTPKQRIIQELAESPEGKARGVPLLRSAIATTEVTWHELREKQGIEFLQCAYQAMLGRDADPDGIKTYLALLRNGTPRVHILEQLLQSSEFSARHLRFQGSPLVKRIALEVRKYRLSQIRVVGWLLGVILRIERDTITHRRLRRIECLLTEIQGAARTPRSKPESD